MSLVPLEASGNDYAVLTPDTDPGSIAPLLHLQAQRAGRRSPFRLQFEQPLPDALYSAAGQAIRQERSIELYAFDHADPSLAWLRHFEGLERLSIHIAEATSFDPIGALVDLEELSLGGTLHRVSPPSGISAS